MKQMWDCIPHLTRAFTANLTTVESRKRGVTRMWKSARAANASEDSGPLASRKWCVTNVCRQTHLKSPAALTHVCGPSVDNHKRLMTDGSPQEQQRWGWRRSWKLFRERTGLRLNHQRMLTCVAAYWTWRCRRRRSWGWWALCLGIPPRSRRRCSPRRTVSAA